MLGTIHQIEKTIILLCQRMNQKNYLSAADGNISYRVSDHEIIITPSGMNKVDLRFGDFAKIDIEGNVISGHPSSEMLMHLEVYRACSEAKAIVHAHPPTAIAWSIARPDLTELPRECMSELIIATGRIPIVPYARPGTAAMGEVIRPYLPHSRVMILAKHGALSWGEDLSEAYNGIERIEHSSQVLKAAQELGGLYPLPYEEIQALEQIRKRIGNRTL